MGEVEWRRGVDLGCVQRADDIVNFEHPFDWPSPRPSQLALSLGSSVRVHVSKCLEERAFSSEWPTQRRWDSLGELKEGNIIDRANNEVAVDGLCVRLGGCVHEGCVHGAWLVA